MNRTGVFCISIDYEMYWGVKDTLGMDYSENILSNQTSIPKVLSLFENYGIHATWAIVAFMLEDPEYVVKSLNSGVLPKYRDEELNKILDLDDILSTDPKLYFSDLYKMVLASENQEVGSHTATHMYSEECENFEVAFRHDLEVASTIFQKNNINATSIVFPRNQYNEMALRMIVERGFVAYRSNPSHWAYTNGTRSTPQISERLYRLVDSFINISGSNSYSIESLEKNNGCLPIPASMMLRPCSKVPLLDKLRIRRIKQSMSIAAKNNQIFHLWWHPHNFGNDVQRNVVNLREILEHYLYLKKRYDFESLNMREVVDRWKS